MSNVAPGGREYLVEGNLGPETGGKLTLNRDDAVCGTSAFGNDRCMHRAILKTNNDSTSLTNGFKVDDTFSVTGIFDLTAPSVPGEKYGIRLTDRAGLEGTPPNGNDIVEISVRRNLADELTVRLRRLDLGNVISTTLESLPLDLSLGDQIALTLSKDSAVSNTITASFSYVNGNIFSAPAVFSTTPEIFNGENFTRVAFVATTPVPTATGPVDLSGTVKTPDGTDICAMVLASGQYMFSCNPIGVFSLTNLPREGNGTVKRQIYADGFFPRVDILRDSSNEAVVMTRSGACPGYNENYDPGVFPSSAGKRINIDGKVLVQETQTAICAMVLANGQYMFSCDGTGSYALNIPLDSNGQYKLQVYADGFAPTIQTFDEFKTTNDVRMARASECR